MAKRDERQMWNTIIVIAKSIKLKFQNFEAVVIQYEIDHLDGRLFLERAASLKTDIFCRRKGEND